MKLDNYKLFRRKVKKMRKEKGDKEKKKIVKKANVKIVKERSAFEERIIAMRHFIARTQTLKRSMLSVRNRTHTIAMVHQGSYSNIWVEFNSEKIIGKFRNSRLRDLMLKDREVLKYFPEIK